MSLNSLLTKLEVLNLFPSCQIPKLDIFLGALDCNNGIPPRYYSIASSPLLSSNTCDICFSIVKTLIASNDNNKRIVYGVCTNELERILNNNNLKFINCIITLKYFGLLVDITQKKEEVFRLDETKVSVSFLKSKLETAYEELKKTTP